jgi:hypothetical protein
MKERAWPVIAQRSSILIPNGIGHDGNTRPLRVIYRYEIAIQMPNKHGYADDRLLKPTRNLAQAIRRRKESVMRSGRFFNMINARRG